MPTENSVITREHLPGLLLARTIWENGGPSLYFPPALQDATDQARAALPAPASVPDGYMPIPTAEQMADALESVRCFHDMSAELIAPELLANLLTSTTVKDEQVQCEVCHGQGEVYSGHDQNFHYFDFQPPEPIMDVCPECGGEEAPSLPAAGTAAEEVKVVGHLSHCTDLYDPDATPPPPQEPLMTVAQHERIVASLQAEIAKRDAAIEEWSGTAVQNGMEVDRLTAALSAQQSDGVDFGFDDRSVRVSQEAYAIFLDREQQLRDDVAALEGQLAAQQSAPERVSVPRDLLADLISSDHDTKIQAERALYALLASHAEGWKV